MVDVNVSDFRFSVFTILIVSSCYYFPVNFILFISVDSVSVNLKLLFSIEIDFQSISIGSVSFSPFIYKDGLLFVNVGATVGIKCHTGFRKRSKWIKAVLH
ncbi:hypothetical protein YC2023_121830 [Brassica napus]